MSTARTDAPRGILMILVDDQGYGDLSAHGHPELKSPALDSLASSSVRFSDFHVAPMCTPTRGSLLTGLDALRHGATNVSSGRAMLSTALPTLSETLRDSGYSTGVFGKWHLGDNHPYRPHERGFDRALWFPSSHVTSAPDRWRNDYFDTWLRSEGDEPQQFSGYCTDILFDQTFEWISERVAADESYFAYLSLNALHQPLLVADEYREPYAHLGSRLSSYLGMIANLDENIARMEERLAQLGIADDTLVIYMSDNGGDRTTVELFNAGMRGAKTELWEGGHRVPAFFRWPAGGVGGDAGADVDNLVVVQDVMPTLLELCGIDAGNLAFDGTSIAPLLRGENDQVDERTCVIQYSRMGSPEPARGDALVMRGKFRLMTADMSLYDVATDPGQTHDIAHRYADLAASMSSYYARWWEGLTAERATVERIVIGSDAEPDVALSPADWRDVFLDQQRQVLEGLPINSHWNIRVERSGRYRFELRRWPREANLAMSAPAESFEGAVSTFMPGRALPVASVRLRLGDIDVRATVPDGDAAVCLDLDLHRGPARLQTWLLDGADEQLAGAYYVYVSRIGDL